MLPIICDVAIKNGIRPERPMAASSIASQMGILASPVSVAVVSLAAFLAKVPVAPSIGVPPGYIVAFAAASHGHYILPTYPSDLAMIQFDRSGTTRIGKYVINHSFILPGLIGVGTSCLAGLVLATARGLI